MASNERQPKQKTQPRGKDETGKPHQPVEIPVPKRSDVERLLKRATNRSAKPKR